MEDEETPDLTYAIYEFVNNGTVYDLCQKKGAMGEAVGQFIAK